MTPQDKLEALLCDLALNPSNKHMGSKLGGNREIFISISILNHSFVDDGPCFKLTDNDLIINKNKILELSLLKCREELDSIFAGDFIKNTVLIMENLYDEANVPDNLKPLARCMVKAREIKEYALTVINQKLNITEQNKDSLPENIKQAIIFLMNKSITTQCML